VKNMRSWGSVSSQKWGRRS